MSGFSPKLAVQRGGRVQLPQYTLCCICGNLGSVRLAPIIILVFTIYDILLYLYSTCKSVGLIHVQPVPRARTKSACMTNQTFQSYPGPSQHGTAPLKKAAGSGDLPPSLGSEFDQSHISRWESQPCHYVREQSWNALNSTPSLLCLSRQASKT